MHLQTGYYSKHDVYNAFPHSFLYTTEMRLVCILPKSFRLEGFLTYDSSIRNSRSKIQQEKTNVWEDRDSTFSEFRPELSYDILHQKGAALSVTAHMLLGWLLTERDRKCVWEGRQREAVCVCVYVAALLARRQDEKGIWAVCAFFKQEDAAGKKKLLMECKT